MYFYVGCKFEIKNLQAPATFLNAFLKYDNTIEFVLITLITMKNHHVFQYN